MIVEWLVGAVLELLGAVFGLLTFTEPTTGGGLATGLALVGAALRLADGWLNWQLLFGALGTILAIEGAHRVARLSLWFYRMVRGGGA